MQTLLTREELVSVVKGDVIENGASCEFTSVVTDSRNVVKGSMFVPLVGTQQNGHIYIPKALEAGASVILMNRDEAEKNPDLYKKIAEENSSTLFVCVDNTLHAFQTAAAAYVEKFPELIKVSITGSCGKTTTKEMMVSVAKEHFGEEHTVYTKGNFNSETGLPLSVFNIRKQHEVGIFEMGMNRENEIGEISNVLKSKYGIITNIGTAHIGLLGSRENIAKEKRKSFDYIPEDGAAFVPAEDDFADYLSENVKGEVVKFGKSVPEEESGVKFIKDNALDGSEFSIDGIKVNLPLSGEYNYQNALGVVACARKLGITADEIRRGLENISSIAGRMENTKVQLKNGKNITLIKDCYNANPDSMGKAIDFCGKLKNVGKKIVVLADMKELGEDSLKEHSKIGVRINSNNIDYAYLVGEEIKPAVETAKGNCKVSYFSINDKDNFALIAENINSIAEEGDVILLKGSHSMELEKLVPLISAGKKAGC